MSGRNTLIAIAVILMAVFLGGVIYLKAKIHAVTEATAPLFIGPTPTTTETKNPASPAAAPREITFSKTLVLREKTMSVDGGDFMPISCSSGSNEPVVFGYIQLTEQHRADLTCAEEYMGGVELTFIDPDGKQKTLKLVSSDGDAGDAWESRSWILKEDGRLKVRTVTLSSSNDTESGELLACNAKKELLVWDAKTQDFSQAVDTPEWSLATFIPPIGISKDCLNPDGTWKGK
jgi:hypothetical protein